MIDAALPLPVQEYLRLRFPAAPGDRPYVILNMVASADGKAVVEGSESALSSPTDKLVLQTLRVHADAILNGAATVRQTGASPRIRDGRLRAVRAERGHPAPPLQVVLSARGTVPPDATFLTRRDFGAVLFLGVEAEPQQVERLRQTGRPMEVLPAGDERLPELMRRLRTRYGVDLLLLEGGPTLNAACFHRGLVDEFFLTVGPHVVGGAATLTTVEGLPFDAASMPALELVSALPSPPTNEVYLHWRVRRV
jgi:riboflavin-specific deaminase-like protein